MAGFSNKNKVLKTMLSIVIVNYNSLALINGCVRSFMDHCKNFPFEIIIVDNSNENGESLLKMYSSIETY